MKTNCVFLITVLFSYGVLCTGDELTNPVPEISLESPQLSLVSAQVSLESPQTSPESPQISLEIPQISQESPQTVKEESVAEGVELEGTTTLDENDGNSTESAAANNTHRVNCIPNHHEEVELVDSTRLINLLMTNPNVTSRQTEAECLVLLFYAPWCPFSSLAAPHFNSLPRAFPTLKMAAVDAMKYPSFNTQYGVVGVPTVILFHNGRIAAKYNQSEYILGMFSSFIEENTGIAPLEKMYVTSGDFAGPVSSTIVRETDYCLWLAWIFIALSAAYLFTKSSLWHYIVEAIQNTWRESEAQHEHIM